MMMTAVVVTLIPPPVEPGAAPMNISTTENTLAASVIEYRSIELKPAVRMVIDCMKAAPILPFISNACIVFSLSHSSPR